MEFNRHAKSYTWKGVLGEEFVILDMDKTLEDNGIKDEAEIFHKLGMDDEYYVPTLHIYFNDDLSIEEE